MTTDVAARTSIPEARCFKDPNRNCGADCMAFHDPGGVVGARWEFCRLLVDSAKSSRHLKVIADAMNTVCTYIDDERRHLQPAPPVVR